MAVPGRTRPRRTLGALACALGLMAQDASLAGDLAYEFRVEAGQSDNITRRAVDPIDETIAAAGLRFSFDQSGARVESDLVGNLAYNDYLDDTYDSEFLGNFVGNVSVELIPERVRWVASDNFGQVLTDPFIPATPENRENLNYFSTGPEAIFEIGSQMQLNAGARYSKTSYESHDFDSDGMLAQLGLERLLSKSSSLGLNVSWQDITYDEATLNADYDEAEAFLRFNAAGARTNLRIDAGYNEIKHSVDDRSDSGPLFRIEASRRVSARSRATLSAGHEFSGSGSAFASAQSGGDITLDPVGGRQTAQPFMLDHARLDWRLNGNRTQFGLSGSWNSQEYSDAPLLDQSFTTIGGTVAHDISPALNLQLELLNTDGNFEQAGGDYQELTAGVSLRWRASRRLSLSLSYDYADRDSDQVAAGYKENRFWLAWAYSYSEPRTALLQPEFRGDAQN
jgi:opacity protein-like surface antigen